VHTAFACGAPQSIKNKLRDGRLETSHGRFHPPLKSLKLLSSLLSVSSQVIIFIVSYFCFCFCPKCSYVRFKTWPILKFLRCMSMSLRGVGAPGNPCTATIFWPIFHLHLPYSASSRLPLTTYLSCIKESHHNGSVPRNIYLSTEILIECDKMSIAFMDSQIQCLLMVDTNKVYLGYSDLPSVLNTSNILFHILILIILVPFLDQSRI
jgi:hypothetical protein